MIDQQIMGNAFAANALNAGSAPASLGTPEQLAGRLLLDWTLKLAGLAPGPSLLPFRLTGQHIAGKKAADVFVCSFLA